MPSQEIVLLDEEDPRLVFYYIESVGNVKSDNSDWCLITLNLYGMLNHFQLSHS